MVVFETKNLVKTYKNKNVVDNVNIKINNGEIYGLIGKNGAGKTTLIRMLLGLTDPNSGSISICGTESKSGLEVERHKIGAIVEQPAFIPHLSALDNLTVIAKSVQKADKEKLKQLLQFVGLNADDKKRAKDFSLGMKQRLSLAMALVCEPSILILDEPQNGLDPTGIFEVRELLQRLNQEKGVTILISSHLLGELSKLATCYGIMDNGKIIREMRGSDLQELCRPFIKIVVDDLKRAIPIILDNYSAQDFEILPFNTIALYNLKFDVAEVATLMRDNGVIVKNMALTEGDLESTFITMIGGLRNEKA